MTVSNNS